MANIYKIIFLILSVDIIIKNALVEATKKAYEQNRILIILAFFFPLIFFTGYLIGILSTGIHLVLTRYVEAETKKRFFDAMTPLIIVLPIMIFYLTSRIFKAKRILVTKGIVSIENGIIKIGNMRIPIPRIKINIYRKTAFLPGNVYLVEICFEYGTYLYKFGEIPDFTFARELRIGGISEVRNLKSGDKICLILPITITQLNKIVFGLKGYKQYLGVKFKTRNRSIKALFRDFEEKSAAKITIKDFSMIGF